MSKKTITLNDIDEMNVLQHQVEALRTNLKQPIIEAVNTLKAYHETINFEPAEALRLLQILGINEIESPEGMNQHIRNSDKAFVTRKKFFNSSLSKKKVETLLIEIVSELLGLVNGDILAAITNLIKNMILICLNESVDTEYKEMCFRFFTRDADHDIVILIINVSYDEHSTKYNFLGKLAKCLFQRARISFFGAIVKTHRKLLAIA